jgi:hypothetical protein
VDRLEEMRGFEKIGNAVERLVVDEDGAEQCLFGLDIVRGRAVGRLAVVRQPAGGRIEKGHDVPCVALVIRPKLGVSTGRFVGRFTPAPRFIADLGISVEMSLAALDLKPW